MPTTARRRRPRSPSPFAAPTESAAAAALRYVHDDQPGITRRRNGRGFSYGLPDGTAMRDPATLRRIRALVIPPAWTDVWICPHPAGHIQATGRDARRRKQYRYHPRWQQVRDETKYERLRLFGVALPRIRARVREDLRRDGLPKEKVLATVVTLLERTRMRVGNDEYARTNQSFGMTTLRNRHVEIDHNALHFHFRGKSGKTHIIDLADARLAKMVRLCRDLPGQQLFQYLTDDGAPQAVTSTDVNEYLRDLAGDDFTAKDFRTWAGTLLAAESLGATVTLETDQSRKSALTDAVKAVASELGNTPAVCRKCYIHPQILAAYVDEGLGASWQAECGNETSVTGLSAMESALLRFLDAGARAA